MRRNIYLNKEAEEVLSHYPNLSLSQLVSTILHSGRLHNLTVRLTRVTPVVSDLPAHYTVPGQQVAIEDGEQQYTILYDPTVQELDRIGATSAQLEWYDERTETWVPGQ